jgi:membrane-bound lytic murein transglycosylase D
MPKTGRLFNLEKTWWSEDRHDPYRSTHAAIGYFKYLFERFDNDIYLALAAYNAGPTYLDRQIRKNKRLGLNTDFFSLNLSKQVTEYIPKYIAIRELVFNAEKYGIDLPDIPTDSVVQKVEIPGQVEIMTLSEYLDIKPELLYKLNAGYTKWASAPKDKSIFLLIKLFFLMTLTAHLKMLIKLIGYHMWYLLVTIFGAWLLNMIQR